MQPSCGYIFTVSVVSMGEPEFGKEIERAGVHIHCQCGFHVCDSEPEFGKEIERAGIHIHCQCSFHACDSE